LQTSAQSERNNCQLKQEISYVFLEREDFNLILLEQKLATAFQIRKHAFNLSHAFCTQNGRPLTRLNPLSNKTHSREQILPLRLDDTIPEQRACFIASS
jgi:hypothetical protein